MQTTQVQDSSYNIDPHGNYKNNGDLYRPNEELESVSARIVLHLKRVFPEYEFASERKTFSGGRSITVKVISGPDTLTNEDEAKKFLKQISQEMKRFDNANGNIYSDYHSCTFFGHAEIDRRYHAQHAVIIEGTEVEPKMTISAFRKALKEGDTIVLEASNQTYSQRMLGIERKVIQVRSKDFITQGEDGRKIYFDLPPASAFACDGEKFRINDARENSPNGFRLYRWNRS